MASFKLFSLKSRITREILIEFFFFFFFANIQKVCLYTVRGQSKGLVTGQRTRDDGLFAL